MHVFIQSLYGKVNKWFRELLVGSINGIKYLEEEFMKQWGDTKEFLYYITKFGALKRNLDESVIDFRKCFNKMCGNIPAEIKTTETSTKVAYVIVSDVNFSLLLK